MHLGMTPKGCHKLQRCQIWLVHADQDQFDGYTIPDPYIVGYLNCAFKPMLCYCHEIKPQLALGCNFEPH